MKGMDYCWKIGKEKGQWRPRRCRCLYSRRRRSCDIDWIGRIFCTEKIRSFHPLIDYGTYIQTQNPLLQKFSIDPLIKEQIEKKKLNKYRIKSTQSVVKKYILLLLIKH